MTSSWSRAIAAVVLALWLAFVLFVLAHHEFWRDEVRALSIARAAGSLPDLVRLIRNEGHPVLWYLILFVGKSVTASSVVLPAASIAVAAAAAALWMRFAPFPLWMRALFLAGLPLFEYSVMARNYGISMLAMFGCAWLWPHRRAHPLLLGAALALLANTNAHSVVLAGALAALWMSDVVFDRAGAPRLRWHAAALAIFAAGVLASIAVARPDAASISRTWIPVDAGGLLSAAARALVAPGELFSLLAPDGVPAVVTSVVLWAAVLGLVSQPRLLASAVVALVGLGVIFQTVYQGGLRHEGLFIVFLATLYWLLLEARGTKALRPEAIAIERLGLYGGMTLLFAGQIWIAARLVSLEVAGEASSSAALGGYLTSHPQYRTATLLPEPDYLIESVAYYAGNPVWLPREHRFAKTVSFTTANDDTLSLGQLVSGARRIENESHAPALVVFGHPVLRGEERVVRFSYGKELRWSDDEVRAFNESFVEVARFDRSYGDENYVVYALR